MLETEQANLEFENELAEDLLAKSLRLEEESARLYGLLHAQGGNGSLPTRVISWVRGDRPALGTDRQEAIRNAIVEVERLLRAVAQTSDHAMLPPETREIVRRRLREAQAVFLPAVEKFPLDRARAAVTEYLEFVLRKNEFLDPRGIRQTVRSVTLPLEEVYVSLAVERDTEALGLWRERLPNEMETDYRVRLAAGRERPSIPVELAPTVRNESRMVILGDPGAGKTTLLRFLAYQFAKAYRQDAPTVQANAEEYGPTHLPILLRIATYAEAFRRSGGTLDLRTFLAEAFAEVPTSQEQVTAVLYEALDNGKALVMLDGLDEIIEPGDRSEIARRIETFVRDHPDNRFIVTSRIAGYQEARLVGPFEQKTYTLRDMERKHVQQFLEHWCPAVERFHTPNASDETLAQAARQEIDGILRAYDESEGVRGLARNPLLLTILALIHRNGVTLPEQRARLYALATDTLLRTWRPAQVGSSAQMVTESEEMSLLTQLARRMHDQETTGLISEGRAVEILREALARERDIAPTSDEVERLVRDFLKRVRLHTGIFVERAPGQYGFMHLTFQEYFAGQWLVSHSPEAAKRIHARRHLLRWREPILLAIGSMRPNDADDVIHAAILGQAEGFAPGAYEAILHRDLLLAAHCLGDCAGGLVPLTRQVANELTDIVLDTGGRGRYSGLREHIGKALRALRRPEVRQGAIGRLVQALQTSETPSAVRMSIAKTLGQLGQAMPEAVTALLVALKDEETYVRGSAAQALGRLGQATPEVITALLTSIKDKEEDVRGSAAEALGRLGQATPEVITALIAALKDNDTAANVSAAWALGMLGQANLDVVAVLLAALTDKDAFARVSAALMLGQLGQATLEAVATLLATLKDEDVFARMFAAWALGRLGQATPEAVAALLAALKDEVDFDRGSAALALGRLGQATPEAVTALLVALKDEETFVRGSAAQALGQLGQVTSEAVTALLVALKDEETFVRGSAAQALGQLGQVTSEVAATLLSALQDGSAPPDDQLWEALWNVVQLQEENLATGTLQESIE